MEEKIENKLLISSDEKDSDFFDEKTKKAIEKYGSKDEDPFTSANFFSRFFLFFSVIGCPGLSTLCSIGC